MRRVFVGIVIGAVLGAAATAGAVATKIVTLNKGDVAFVPAANVDCAVVATQNGTIVCGKIGGNKTGLTVQINRKFAAVFRGNRPLFIEDR